MVDYRRDLQISIDRDHRYNIRQPDGALNFGVNVATHEEASRYLPKCPPGSKVITCDPRLADLGI